MPRREVVIKFLLFAAKVAQEFFSGEQIKGLVGPTPCVQQSLLTCVKRNNKLRLILEYSGGWYYIPCLTNYLFNKHTSLEVLRDFIANFIADFSPILPSSLLHLPFFPFLFLLLLFLVLLALLLQIFIQLLGLLVLFVLLGLLVLAHWLFLVERPLRAERSKEIHQGESWRIDRLGAAWNRRRGRVFGVRSFDSLAGTHRYVAEEGAFEGTFRLGVDAFKIFGATSKYVPRASAFFILNLWR